MALEITTAFTVNETTVQGVFTFHMALRHLPQGLLFDIKVAIVNMSVGCVGPAGVLSGVVCSGGGGIASCPVYCCVGPGTVGTIVAC